MKTSVILSTYNSVEWLEKVLWGLSIQTYRDFEIIIADDGSLLATKNLIDKLRIEIDIPIIHIWHEDTIKVVCLYGMKTTVFKNLKY